MATLKEIVAEINEISPKPYKPTSFKNKETALAKLKELWDANLKDKPKNASKAEDEAKAPIETDEAQLLPPKVLAYHFGITAKTLRVKLREHYAKNPDLAGIGHDKMQRYHLPLQEASEILGLPIVNEA